MRACCDLLELIVRKLDAVFWLYWRFCSSSRLHHRACVEIVRRHAVWQGIGDGNVIDHGSYLHFIYRRNYHWVLKKIAWTL
ncbi:hypothetical protein Plhal304r1_c028g0092701 [Plasmopara halstedii]